jgi:hypothetical protein
MLSSPWYCQAHHHQHCQDWAKVPHRFVGIHCLHIVVHILIWFFADTLPCKLIGMSLASMCQYINSSWTVFLYPLVMTRSIMSPTPLTLWIRFRCKRVSDYSKANINHSSTPTAKSDSLHKALYVSASSCRCFDLITLIVQLTQGGLLAIYLVYIFLYISQSLCSIL